MNTAIPPYVEPFLWSYDVTALNLAQDKQLIIHQVLNHGSKQATDWLQTAYSAEAIQTVIKSTPVSAWSKKSLALWSLLYNVYPTQSRRFNIA